MSTINCIDSESGNDYVMINGDSVEVVPQFPPNSIDMMVYSPPFSDIFVYSDSERDIGNNATDDMFIEHYGLLVESLFKVLRPGRVCAVHCKDLPSFLWKHGEVGLRDFPGALIKAHQKAGFIFHSRTTIELDPVTEMQRTNAHGLLYKNFKANAEVCRQGLADYIVTFRKPGNKDDPAYRPVVHDESVEVWQRWANPAWLSSFTEQDEEFVKATAAVWHDIDQTNTLNVREGRDQSDERHMCPLQLDTIERLVRLWTNPGEVVMSPFGGVGSEGYGCMTFGRKYVGIELKKSYYKTAIRNLRAKDSANAGPTLFSWSSK